MSRKSFRRGPRLPQKGPNALLLLLFLLAGFVGYLMWYNSTHTQTERIIYSTFLSRVEKGLVSSVVVHDGMHVQGVYVNGKAFEAEVVPSSELWQTLRKHSVNVDVRHQDHQPWGGLAMLLFLPMLLAFAFFYFRNSQAGNGAGKIFSMGKSKARFFSPSTMGVTFKDVAGAHEAKEELKDVVDFLKHPDKYSRLGAKIPRGVLLCGAPGNGKTLLAKAVAGEANCPFFSISGSDFVEVFVGVGASRVRDLFAQARKSAPCIVFIDEIDAVGRQRGVGMGGGNDEREQTLNQLLAEMDGFSTNSRGSVIVLAATNRPDVLDKALLRPGRFDRRVEVPYPDLVSRKQILEVHIRKTPLAEDVDIERIARGTPGFSGADLENLINEAALAASKAGKEDVNINDFERARDRIMLGAERSTMIITEDDKKLTAFHEGGHALMNVLLPKTDPFHKVTIIPRGRALGVSWSLPERDKHTETREAMVQRIKVALGGLIAERMVFDEVTSGPASDIATATSLAREMVCTYGMSSLGPISYRSSQHAYLGTGGASGDYSADTARRIDEEVEKIIKQCEKEAEKLMRDNRDKLDLLATTLLEKETLHADEVYELLNIEPRTYHSFLPEEKKSKPKGITTIIKVRGPLEDGDEDLDEDAGAEEA